MIKARVLGFCTAGLLLCGCNEPTRQVDLQAPLSPSFSLGEAEGVTAELLRDAYFVSSGGTDTLSVADTTVYTPFVDYFAVPDSVAAIGAAVAAQSHMQFDSILDGGGGYWAITDTGGTYQGLRVAYGDEGAWARITVYEGESAFTADSTASYELNWTETTGGWLLDSADVRLYLGDGSHVLIHSVRGSTTYASMPSAVPPLTLAMLGGGMLCPSPLYATSTGSVSTLVIGDCGSELTSAGLAVGAGVAAWSLYKLFPNSTTWKIAWSATGRAIVAVQRAAQCLWDEEQQPDPF